jgi:hypothetical protein
MSDTTKNTKREKKTYENDQYFAMVGRMVRAAGKRAAEDVDALPFLLDLQKQVEAATVTAIEGLKADGYSWADIADRVGMTRQGAAQLYKRAKKNQ